MNLKRKAATGLMALVCVVATGEAHTAEREAFRGNQSRTEGMVDIGQHHASPQQSSLAQRLGLSELNTLKAIKTHRDPNGVITTRYHQFYDGIPVWGSQIIIQTDKHGVFKKASGTALYDIEDDIVSTQPRLTEKESIKTAKQQIRSQFNPVDIQSMHADLAIWQDYTGKAHLIYDVSLFLQSDQAYRPRFMVDAISGRILHAYEDLKRYQATGPGGNMNTGMYYFGTDYDYLEVTRTGDTCFLLNEKVKTIDLNYGYGNALANAHDFPCPDNGYKMVNGGFSPLNDAHFFASETVAMFNDWLGVDPMPFQVVMRIHYSDGLDAFWDGSTVTFGDGDDAYYPMTSVEVVAHEIAHGFTDQYSDLVYNTLPEGALNEAFSDITGVAVSYYLTGENNWKIGATLGKNREALRHFDVPERDGVSISHVSDYEDYMDNHYSSGVYNHAFYKLATTPGWNTKMAFQVYARANMLYWHPYSDWMDAGEGLMESACDLGFEIDAVKSSLSEVGIHVTLRNGESCSMANTEFWMISISEYILM